MSDRIVMTAIAMLSLALASGAALAQHSHDKDHQMMGGQEEPENGHSHKMAMVHGGQVTMTPHHHFEVLFADSLARVYVYDGKQVPVDDPKNVKASMTLVVKGGEPETMDLQYIAPDPDKGRTQGYFYLHDRMADMKGHDMKAIVRLVGLEEDPIEFRTPVTMGEAVSYVCPMRDSDPAEDPGSCPKCGMQMKADGHEKHKDSGHEHGETEEAHRR